MFEKTLTLSTAHMTPETDILLTSLSKERTEKETGHPDEGDLLPFRFVTSHHYGYILFMRDSLFEEPESRLKIIKQVPELWPVIEFAKKNDCTLINLDRDAEMIEGLHTFKW